MPKKDSNSGSSPHGQLVRDFARYTPGVFGLLTQDAEDFVNLRFYSRGPSDVIGVLKRYGSDGSIQVVFGSSFDVVGAFLSLEGAVQNNRWRVDTPFEQRGR